MKKLIISAIALIIAMSVLAVSAFADTVDATSGLVLNADISGSECSYENATLKATGNWVKAYVDLAEPASLVKSFTLNYTANNGFDLHYMYTDGQDVNLGWKNGGTGVVTVNVDSSKTLQSVGIQGTDVEVTISLTYETYSEDDALYQVGDEKFFDLANAFKAARINEEILDLANGTTLIKHLVDKELIVGIAAGESKWDAETYTVTLEDRFEAAPNFNYIAVDFGKAYPNAKAFLLELESAVDTSFGAAAVLVDESGTALHYAHNAKQTIGLYAVGSDIGAGMPIDHKTTYGFAFLNSNAAEGLSFPLVNTMTGLRISGNTYGVTATIKDIYVLAEAIEGETYEPVEVEEPADEPTEEPNEDPAESEDPVGETTDTEPPATGLTTALLPIVFAAIAVVFSKKR